MSLLQNSLWDKASLGQNIPLGQTVRPRFFDKKKKKCPRIFRNVLSFLTHYYTLLKIKFFSQTVITYTLKSVPYFFHKIYQTSPIFFWSRIAIGKQSEPEPHHFSVLEQVLEPQANVTPEHCLKVLIHLNLSTRHTVAGFLRGVIILV
jgi:hypothetical protein